MLDRKKIDEVVKKLVDSMPAGVQNIKSEMEKNFSKVLHAAFSKMDLVTREEFDAHVKVLHRTQKKLEELEKKVSGHEEHTKHKKSESK